MSHPLLLNMSKYRRTTEIVNNWWKKHHSRWNTSKYSTTKKPTYETSNVGLHIYKDPTFYFRFHSSTCLFLAQLFSCYARMRKWRHINQESEKRNKHSGPMVSQITNQLVWEYLFVSEMDERSSKEHEFSEWSFLVSGFGLLKKNEDKRGSGAKAFRFSALVFTLEFPIIRPA